LDNGQELGCRGKYHFQLDDVIKLTGESFAAIANEGWKQWCAHVQNIEAQYMTSGGILYEGCEIVIHVGYDMTTVMEMTVIQTR
jgi:phosphotransferase system IIA component